MELKERCEGTDTVHQFSALELDRWLYESEALMAASFLSLLKWQTSDHSGGERGLCFRLYVKASASFEMAAQC